MKKILCILTLTVGLSSFARPDILIENFESGSYAPNWTLEGEAFGPAPAKGGFSNQQKVSEYGGEFLVDTYFKGDGTVGKITSAPFKIERKYLEALVGGGENQGRLYLRVLADGKELGRITGFNDEKLGLRTIDLGGHLGKTAVIEIVDNATGGWGHINVDEITLTDYPKGFALKAQVKIEKAKRYLNIPINNDAPERRVRVSDLSGETVLLDSKIRVDFKNFQWIYSMEARELEGSTLKIESDAKLGEDISFETTDKYNTGDYPNELLRPQYHFSAPQGWLNDPNGLVYWRGKWHMYYQLSPYTLYSREKYWGYAVSDDLIRWRHKPVAINVAYYPKGGQNAIWSGTAFADTKNRSGFFDKNGGLVFAYTFIGLGDYVAYSPDGLGIRTLENPITKAPGRDPCIFYHEPSQKWVALRYEEVKDEKNGKALRKFVFYSSKDLQNWDRGQVLDDFYECPYMISMPVNGNKNKMKYLIFDAEGECVIGDFDGEKFTAIGGRRPKFILGEGYAGQVFNNAPQGRIVNISWFRQRPEDFVKMGMGFSQMMTVPAELKLVEKSGVYAIHASPVAELKKLYGKETRLKNLSDTMEIPSSAMIEADFDMSAAENAKIQIGPVSINFVKAENTYHIRTLPPSERTAKTRDLSWPNNHFKMDGAAGDRLRLKVFIDRSSMEIFHEDKTIITVRASFGDEVQKLSISGNGVAFRELLIREMKAAFSKDSLDDL